MDRIDIHVEGPRVEYDKLADDRKGEPSATIRERVEAARQFQHTCGPNRDQLVLPPERARHQLMQDVI
jgi:predicted ATPase with chaperone activity